MMLEGGRGGDLDSDEAITRSKRTTEQVQAKNRNKNNTFQSDTPAGQRIVCIVRIVCVLYVLYVMHVLYVYCMYCMFCMYCTYCMHCYVLFCIVM